MKADVKLLARVYCLAAAVVLIALGLGAWTEGRGNQYSGALLCGTGLFLFAGAFAGPARLTALLALCICFFGAAFLIGTGLQLLHAQWPSGATLTLWLAELAACAAAAPLALRLYRASL